MTTEQDLHARSDAKCELCGASDNLTVYAVPPASDETAEQSILACASCQGQIEDEGALDANHWRCLNDSMWTPVPAVQVMAWRMLSRLNNEIWAQDLLAQLYLDDETLAWAQADGNSGDNDTDEKHLDSNGAELLSGDTVTLIKDLNVKGANFTAKRGTAVRGISLVQGNPEQIEGRVSGQQIVILTKFVKKS
ncbi:PhnA domain-containing protein [Kiloniella laminariae]|uniref:PhnA domain-containing protein n=1 Tax=Kiloniella laminariae TaxID=454162 RepID=UPI00036BBDA3|nr:alkylphosphonate utilization protein [Kiloniella laminariae]